MKATRLALLALASALAIAPLASANPERDEAAAAKQLAEARARLEAAAREVAELSMKAHGPGDRQVLRMMVGGEGRKAMIGVSLDTEAPAGGARVASVSPGGPAADAGVLAGDVIIALDGKSLADARELTKAMVGVEPGQKLKLDLRRDGKPVKVVVVARPLGRMMLMGGPEGMHPPMPPMPHLPGMPQIHMEKWLLGGFGDAEFATLSPRLGRYFGADKGVLVTRAPKDLGLEDGDVITAIGGREPLSGPHAMRILRSYQPGEEIEFRILRDRKAQTVKVKAPEAGQGEKHIERRRVITPPPGKAPASPPPPGDPA